MAQSTNWEAVGHEWAARLLQEHIKRGEMRHAYLFTGPSGVGRRTLALQFACALNCTNPPAPGMSCGTCRVCRQTLAMQHSDMTILQAENEGGMMKVEQVREAQRALSLLPREARFRIALLLRFQEANSSAQNALLKTLEEAPQRVILLLTADSAESLLPTIVSRCEVLRLRPMPLARLAEELQARGLAQEDVRLLAHLSSGRLGYALRMKENPDFMAQRQALIEDLLRMLQSNRRDRFQYAEIMAKDKDALRGAIPVWLSFWRDIMLRASGPDLPLVNLDMEAEIDELAGMIDLPTARACVTGLEQASDQLDANLNTRLLTEIMLLDWPRLG